MIDFKSLPWKKIGLIFGFVLIVVVVGFMLYTMFFKPVGPTPINQPSNITPTNLPISGQRPPTNGATNGENVVNIPTGQEITRTNPTNPDRTVSEVAEGGLTRVTDVDYSSSDIASVPGSNTLMDYDKNTGEFFKLSPDGTKVSLTDTKFKDVQTVNWAPKSEKAILEFPDGSNILYDFKTDKQVTLPKNWTSFGFSADESQIGFKDMDDNPDKRFVGVSNPDGSNQKYIEHIGNEASKVKVQWSPSGQMFATYETATSTNFKKVFFIGQNGENFRSMEINGLGFNYKYTPTGSQMVYSAHNSLTQDKPQLYVVDASGDNIGYNHKQINLQTWADKCVFSGKTTMYCAVPKEMPEGAGWFPELTDNIGDYIYSVDTITGATSFIAEPEYEYSIKQLQVSSDGNQLYFTDKNSQNLHTIKLK